VVFRTEDEATLRHVQHLLGQIDVVLTSTGDSYSESQAGRASAWVAVKAPTRNRPVKAKTPR